MRNEAEGMGQSEGRQAKARIRTGDLFRYAVGEKVNAYCSWLKGFKRECKGRKSEARCCPLSLTWPMPIGWRYGTDDVGVVDGQID